jgi:glucose/arabinose dehydrogenase
MGRLLPALVLTLALAACGGGTPAPDQGYGANPQLPAPEKGGPIPTLEAAEAVGWPEGGAPTAPAGFTVTRYAEDLDHPRWLYVLPNADVLVAESATLARRGGGIEGWIANRMQRRAGALGGSANRITLLRDADGDGDIDARHVFAENLNQPFGMALVGDYFYVGNTDAVVRFRYAPGAVRVTGEPETVLELPHRENNGHWTRSLAVAPDGSKLYVAVGSATNIADDGLEVERGRAAIWEFNPDGSEARMYASGLRNPVGLEFEPHSGMLWTAVNERDMLGDNLVPDYMTSVQDGDFFGWPWFYYGDHRDNRVPQTGLTEDVVPRAPDYALGAHTASLGLHFYSADQLPEHYWNGVFIGQHGSWNRRAPAGYKVIYVPFANGRPAGDVEDFLTGFLNDRGQAQGRPVGVTTDRTGALLVADDVGNILWRVSYNEPPASR